MAPACDVVVLLISTAEAWAFVDAQCTGHAIALCISCRRYFMTRHFGMPFHPKRWFCPACHTADLAESVLAHLRLHHGLVIWTAQTVRTPEASSPQPARSPFAADERALIRCDHVIAYCHHCTTWFGYGDLRYDVTGSPVCRTCGRGILPSIRLHLLHCMKASVRLPAYSRDLIRTRLTRVDAAERLLIETAMRLRGHMARRESA